MSENTLRKRKSSQSEIVFVPVEEPDIHIDFDQIPEYQRGELAKFALDLTRNLFAVPGEEERYQKWLADRKKRLACG